MAVESKEDIIKALRESAQRMKKVREAATTLRLTRLGAEPNPIPLADSGIQPPARFSGQPEGPNAPTR